MKKKFDFFMTDMCNSNCPYCFVDTKENIDEAHFMSKAQIAEYTKSVCEDSEVTIFGGEPSFAPEACCFLVSELQKRNVSDITLYSNGRDINFLREMKECGVSVAVNLDAYLSNSDKLSDISDFRWNFTISPSNMRHLSFVYRMFIEYDKKIDIKIERYYKRGAVFWNEESLKTFDAHLKNLYDDYVENIVKRHANYMPYVLKNSLIRMIALVSGNEMPRDCSNKTMFFPDRTKQMCYSCKSSESISDDCKACSLGSVCDFTKTCFSHYPEHIRKSLCSLEDILFRRATHVMHDMKENSTFQRAVLSMCENNFYGKII